MRHLVVGAAQLEREHRLLVLALQQHAVAEAPRQRRRELERRLDRDVVDLGGQDLLQVVDGHGGRRRRQRDGCSERSRKRRARGQSAARVAPRAFLLGLRASATLAPPCRAPARHRRRRSPSSTWARTASGSRSAASRATRSSASTPGARRCASAPASTTSGRLTPQARRAALACLARFGERLSGPASVGGARGRDQHVPRREERARRSCRRPSARSASRSTSSRGHEEARLIYLGVAHVLPPSTTPRLVIDIGGGSTEFIIGRGLEPERLESLQARLRRHDAALLPRRQARAPTRSPPPRPHARAEIEAIAREFGREHWNEAYASSGTALALAEILEQNGLSAGGITPRRPRAAAQAHGRRRPHRAAAARRRSSPSARRCSRAASRSWRPRSPSSTSPRINPVGGALRLGVLYDLLGRTVRPRQPRRRRSSGSSSATASIARTRRASRRWRRALYRKSAPRPMPAAAQRLEWAALLHEIGYLGLAHRLPQARRLHPRERRHAGLLRAGAAATSRCWCWAAAAACQDGGRARRRATSRAAARAAARRAVPPRAARRSTRRASRSRSGARDPLRACRRAGCKAHPLTAHLLDKERDEWTALGIRGVARGDIVRQVGRRDDAGDLAARRAGEEAPHLAGGDVGGQHLVVAEVRVVALVQRATSRRRSGSTARRADRTTGRRGSRTASPLMLPRLSASACAGSPDQHEDVPARTARRVGVAVRPRASG